MTRVRRLLPTLVLGSVRSTRANTAAFEFVKRYTPKKLATEPGGLSTTDGPVVLPLLTPYSPARVIFLVRYDTMPSSRLRSPPVVGLPYCPYAVMRSPPTRLASSVGLTRTETRPIRSLRLSPVPPL